MYGGLQQQMFVQQTHEFECLVKNTVTHRLVTNENKLIISAPIIEFNGKIERSQLPNHVNADDDFGIIQTVYKDTCQAWYVFIPNFTVHPTSIKEIEHEAILRWKRRKAFSRFAEDSNFDYKSKVRKQPSNLTIPYNCYTFWIDLPASDRGLHPYFYSSSSNFHNSLDRQQLLGVGSISNQLGLSDADKPQHPYPIHTPIGIGGNFGIIDSFRYEFHACTWLVAMRGGQVIHYFNHVEWEFDIWGGVQRNLLNIVNTTKNGGIVIKSKGKGKGNCIPVIGGIKADERRTVTEWSQPFIDPDGIF